MNSPTPKRTGKYHLVLERTGGMKMSADVFASESVPVERGALDQLADAACLPGVARVLATPDIHIGYGVPIGAVVAAEDFISPAAVGYDINCGMRLLTTPRDAAEVDVRSLARQIRGVVPLGEGKCNVRISRKGTQRVLERGITGLLDSIENEVQQFPDGEILSALDLDEERALLERVERRGSLPGNPGAVPDRAKERGQPQVGTLGGGNHFIELQRVDRVEDQEVAQAWGIRKGQLVVMIHSGSRGLGHEVGGHYMKLASKYDRQQGIKVPNSNLSILPLDSRPGKDYLGAMNAAANYAFANRAMMAVLAKGVIGRYLGKVEIGTVYDVAHNLAALERHHHREWMVHRKGATRAFPAERMAGTPFSDRGQPVLVPGSMGTASWLLRGIPEGEITLFSTNHGAGRVMSRKAARGRRRGRRGKIVQPGAISDRDFEESMSGVHLICEDPRSIKEEAPAAYKDIEAVIETVIGAGMAAPVARMVPLAVLKG
jgi:tRNA-splicing ligase RtcB